MGTSGTQPPAQERPQTPRGPVAVQAPGRLSREGLPQSRRLSRARDLTTVLRSGRRHRTPRLDILWLPNTVGHPRLGLVVPLYGRPVVARNRLRRRLREIARRRVLPGLAPIDFVVRPRHAAYEADYHELQTDLDQWAVTGSR